ncbi:uncharacterized protein L201_001389 [Kwoniella dendrophila CBS 6074]|uniref:Sugar phosphate transporter domain-containing protein n=1 Tax=Kwoniella dendrophila CBS 6074 TaxID=1295534 RepID=A0AAX4JM53_9TREE
MSNQSEYLAPIASHQQPLNRYIPQSPKPDSPPQTPSPISPGKSTLSLSSIPPTLIASTGQQEMVDQIDERDNNNIENKPKGTPEGYTYGQSQTSNTSNSLQRVESRSSSGLGIGINFPPESNPLPKELHSPKLNGSNFDQNSNYNIMPNTTTTTIGGAAQPSISMQKRKSSDGSIAISFQNQNQPNQNDSSSSSGMTHSLSAGSTSSQSQSYLNNQHQHQNLSPFPSNPNIASSSSSSSSTSQSQYNTPPRPRTVSPRHGVNGSSTFASGSSLGKSNLGLGLGGGEPRERVLSPHKLSDPNGNVPSTYNCNNEHFSEDNHNLRQGLNHNDSDPNNPYDNNYPKEKQNWQSANNAFNSFGGVGSQPYFPLTGKEHMLGNSPTVHPKKVPLTDSVAFWLALYFCFNLGLTLFNKFVLVSFPFPYTLTGLHALSGCAGTYIALEQGAFTPARLTQKENVILAAFSVLYTINIAVSNISLQLVSIPFHQVVRASTPLFTIFIAAIFLRARFSAMKLVSLLPVVAGVGFATYGDYDFTALGLILTLLGTFLAALKTVVTNLIQTGGGGRLRLHPLDLLMRMSPLAFIQCVIYGWYTGELERVRRYGATQMTRSKAIALLFNGVFAFGLNIVSFTANKKAGALTMTVSANCKQVLTIVLAVMLFNLHISPTNGLGILLTLVGGGWYGYVEYMEKKKKSKVLERA